MNIATELRNLEIVMPVWDREQRDMVEKPVKPYVFERDGQVFVSAEHGDNMADYYGEYRGGYPWIRPELEEFAKQHGGHWEWQNPGAIVFVQN
jgi:hypothetical protein